MSKKDKKNVTRYFKLSNLAVDNRTSVLLLSFLLLFAGMGAYNSMPKENFPEITIPTVRVGIAYPGNSPIKIEQAITKHVEKEINTISGVKEITSTSIDGYSNTMVEFDFDADINKALQEVKDAVDVAKNEFPDDVEDSDITVAEIDFSEIPVLNINLSGDNYSLKSLKKYGEYLEDEIEKLPEISKVEIRGGRDDVVRIKIDKFKMEAIQVSFFDIEEKIERANSTLSGGNLETGGFERAVLLDGEFQSKEDIENLIIKNDHGGIVKLKDVAEVSFEEADRTGYARTDSSNVVVTLEIKKRAGENLLIATDKILEILGEARQTLPQDLIIETSNDTSRQTRTMVDNLENSIISGVILVVLVLLFFLGLRNAMFVGIAIPLSMLMGFLILSATGNTLNTMVLFSLILALGMLVDNGIVVVENIYRQMALGKDHSEAAKQGVGEVAWPIISSTLTTLAAFLPLVFWDDIMGEFMKYLPITLIIVLSSSLFVALVINPVLTSMFMEVQETKKRSKLSKKQWIIVSVVLVISILLYVVSFISGIPGPEDPGTPTLLWANILMAIVLLILINVYILTPISYRFQNVFLVRLENGYDKLISWALKTWRPYFIFGSMFVLLIFSLWFFGFRRPDVVTFPENIPNYVNIFIELPTGTDMERTDTFTMEVEYIVKDVLEEYYDKGIIESYLTNVGEGTSDPNAGMSLDFGSSSNKAKITVSFVEFQDRLLPSGETISTDVILNEIRSALDTVPGAKITVDKDPNGPPLGPPIAIEISGDNFDSLIDISARVKELIESSDIQGIEELKSDLDVGKPELRLIPNSEAIGLYGLSNQQVLGTIRTALYGKEVSKFKGIDRGFNGEEDDIPIELRLKDEYRYDIEDLLSQRVTFRDQADGKVKQVPISAVVTPSYETTYGSVNRKDQDRVVTLYSNVLDGYNLNQIIAQLEILFSDYDGIPEGYDINFSGEKAEQEKSMAFLQTAFLIAVFLIAIILVSQFNSLAKPVIILLSVVFSTIGVFLGIAIFRMDFVVIMTGIGIISLAGVVVNNAIVLIDYTDLVRQRMRSKLGFKGDRLPKEVIVDCIKEGGKTRLRPVLLTAITTVLGLIPLAIGLNINFFKLFTHLNPEIYVGGDQVIFWGPMSKTIIMGLTFATFLTLVVVPVMYLIFDRVAYKVFVLVKGEDALEKPDPDSE